MTMDVDQYMAERISSRTIRTGGTTSCFYEYIHGDNGAGIGASHQTGWTGTIAKAIQAFGHVTKADVHADMKFKSSKPVPIAEPAA